MISHKLWTLNKLWLTYRNHVLYYRLRTDKNNIYKSCKNYNKLKFYFIFYFLPFINNFLHTDGRKNVSVLIMGFGWNVWELQSWNRTRDWSVLFEGFSWIINYFTVPLTVVWNPIIPVLSVTISAECGWWPSTVHGPLHFSLYFLCNLLKLNYFYLKRRVLVSGVKWWIVKECNSARCGKEATHARTYPWSRVHTNRISLVGSRRYSGDFVVKLLELCRWVCGGGAGRTKVGYWD